MGIAFDKCVRNGGEVKTETLPGKKYRRVCYIDGKKYLGEIKKKKKR